MTFTVYGLRVRDTIGVSYIGQTGKDLPERLRMHVSASRVHKGFDPFDLPKWLRENYGSVEIFQISTHSTREEARIAERAAVEFAVVLGHDLLNRWLVPAASRRPAFVPAWKKAAA